MKKWLSVLFAVVLVPTALLAAACGPTVPPDEGGGGGDDNPPPGPVEVVKADNNVFLVGSWVTYYPYSIKSHDEQMKLLSESGVNFNCFPADYANDEARDDLEDWLETDALCTKYKMFYNLGVTQLNYNVDAFSRNTEIGLELAKRGKGEYMLGYHLWDEPFYDRLEECADWFHKYGDEDPANPGFVNLNGSSGVPGIDMYTYAKRWAQLAGPTLPYLGYDLYPFATNYTYDAAKFANMEVLRRVAVEEGGLRTHAFVQSTGWQTHRMPNFGEISWDVWSLVTYGFKAVSYFNYVCPPVSQGEGFFESLIYRDGTIHDQQLFDDVADMNWKVRAVGDLLMNYDAVHAYHSSKSYSGVETLPDDYFIRTSEPKVVLSYFEPKDGTSPNHIMLFNDSFTSARTVEFAVDANSGLTKLEYFNPETKKYENVDISDGTFRVDFATGEGRLYRIRGDVEG